MRPLGLRAKFFLYSNALIVLSMSVQTFVAVRHERQSRYESIAQRGLSIAEVLSIPITDALMYQEVGLVSEEGLIDAYVAEVLERNRDLVRYVIVNDPSGRVTHSSRWELLGRPYERALGPDAIGKPAASETRTDGSEPVLEIRVPLHVSSRFWGSLAVGFSLARIHPEVGAIERRAVLVALILMLVNSLLTAVYVETLIRPVLHLHRIMKAASRGDLTVRAEHGRGDEVAELRGAFNAMMDELQRARERDKAQEVQLAQAEKMAAIGTLAAGVAHEVNNPLAGMLTCLDMIESNPDDAAARERYLGLVRSGIKRIERIVRNLLDFSRPRAIERRLTSMNERVARVVELVAFQLRNGRVEVRPELAADGVYVLADPFQMEQMLLNLVLNAIQAMPKGGTLTVRTRRQDDRVLVEVIDTGVGIPDAHRSRVFDPFFTTREIGKGTGLGLAVSYNLVKAHGGTIDLDSEPGKGTVARVTLPAAAAPDAREGIA